MTGSRSKIYTEVYKGQLIEIYEFMQSMPGVVTSSCFDVEVNGREVPGVFDKRSYEAFGPATYSASAPNPKQSSALAAARAYCDRKAEAKE